MKRILLILTALFTISQANAQETLIDFGDEKISPAEFKRVYLKNNSGEMVEKSSVDEYMDLYINFRLKVLEAEARGLDTNSAFVKELAGYRKQLAQPYLTAEGMIEELKREGYERLKQEVRVSHILIASKAEDAPEDTLAAYQEAQKVKKRLERGENFEAMALRYSDDPSVKDNKGELGYFTAFYMVYPFETAAYETPVGEISEITKTRFGYHLLKVHDRRPNSGEHTVSHILISTDPEISKVSDPEAKINEIYEEVKSGVPFEEMAQKFSDDSRSAGSGGVLPIFGVGRMMRPFEEAAFKLEKDGDISEPFQTRLGWHIVKRLKVDKMGTYDEIEKVIDQRVRKDSRSKLGQIEVVKRIKDQYGFEESQKALEAFYKVMDSSYFKNAWSPEAAKGMKKELFSIGERSIGQDEFTTYLNETQKGSRPMDLRALVNQRYSAFKEKKLLEYKDQQLESEYPEFKALVEEYHDGILLFNLTDELVWSKASTDTAGLEAFYEANKANYRWDKRLDAVIYTLKDAKISKQVKALIAKGIEADSIMEIVNESSQLNLRYEQKKYEMADHPILSQVKWESGVQEFEKENRIVLVHVKEVLEPGFKQLDEAKGMIISDYQEQLEADWIKELRSKYDYSINQEQLEQLKNELN